MNDQIKAEHPSDQYFNDLAKIVFELNRAHPWKGLQHWMIAAMRDAYNYGEKAAHARYAGSGEAKLPMSFVKSIATTAHGQLEQLTADFVEEMDKLSNRNYQLRMENEELKSRLQGDSVAQPKVPDGFEQCIKIVESYQVPVGNSAAGEMACEWTMDALKEIREAMLSAQESNK